MTKKALKLENNYYINMDTVTEFSIEGQWLSITTTAHPEIGRYVVALQGSQDASYARFTVPINELHRIKRELGEYMGVDLNSEVS
ncbi:hypothetical protein APQ14_19205 [Vibrio toranzoniae]|uniref:Uncharacterized protein n=1 Tax=Vibrio toranzoniae TaxID=1194427 RepID=A0A109D5K0_9VIBR|nr:hypothetical protein [Vibrio toranzoniae]KWT98979.1 hypothetical protein APQ14_19205 [Vibrio toranzoniae]SBS39834.1 hypothetical protein VTO7225_03789 [Vibrio toranzoniae]